MEWPCNVVYHYKWPDGTENLFYVRPDGKVEIIAGCGPDGKSGMTMGEYYLGIDPDFKKIMARISSKDLPLFIGWPEHSAAFFRLLEVG